MILLEFGGAHAGMGHHDQFHHAVLTRFGEGLHVPVEHRLERLLILPFGMVGRHGLHAIEREGQLDIHRVFHPQCAVVIEGGDALIDGDEVGPALRGNAGDELCDCGFGRAVVPGRQFGARAFAPLLRKAALPTALEGPSCPRSKHGGRYRRSD